MIDRSEGRHGHAVVFCALAFLVACGTGRSAPSPILFETDPTAFSICEQERAVVAVRVAWVGLEDAPDHPPDITWRTEDHRVLAVTASGIVTGLEPGEARLIARVDWAGHSLERPVRVTVKPGQSPDQRPGRATVVSASSGNKVCSDPPDPSVA